MERHGILPSSFLDRLLRERGVELDELNIEELWRLVSEIERLSGKSFVRMDFGVPGLPPPELAREAQAKALRTSEVAGRYPPPDGVPELRRALARFLSAALGLRIGESECIATCGATQALFVAQAMAASRRPGRSTVLFLEPGYPPTKAQARFLGLDRLGLDLDRHRGPALVQAVDRATASGEVASISWSSPQNPTWLQLTSEELAEIGRLCTERDVVAIEDLAYLAVDPETKEPLGEAPLQNSIARYTDRYLLVWSASKMLSYAGERVGALIGSPILLSERYPGLESRYGTSSVRRALVGSVFELTAGAPHSAQHAVAALLDKALEGSYDLLGALAGYRERARAVKGLLRAHGFRLIYEPADGRALGDGFYFTFGYPGMSGAELLRELLYYGISALPLDSFGSCRSDGLRACVSRVQQEDLTRLSRRLSSFSADRRLAA